MKFSGTIKHKADPSCPPITAIATVAPACYPE
jgi:hypothetical protein